MWLKLGAAETEFVCMLSEVALGTKPEGERLKRRKALEAWEGGDGAAGEWAGGHEKKQG